MALDSVSLILSVEARFSIHISGEEAARIHTVGDLHATVCEKLGAAEPHQGAAIYNELAQLIAEELGIPEEKITPTARFVEDLRID